MYVSLQKPHAFVEREQQYLKHIKRINKIIKDHKMKECHWDQIINYPKSNRQTQKSINYKKIQQQNGRLANKLINITRRKTYSNSIASTPHRPSPNRIKMQRKIQIQNITLAQRLLSKESEFNRDKMIKQIQEYERIKKSMMKNRRLNFFNNPQSSIQHLSIQKTSFFNKSNTT